MAAPPRPVAPHVNSAFFPDMQSGTTSVVRLLLCVCVCACVHACACVRVCLRLCMYVCVCGVCVCVCARTCVFACYACQQRLYDTSVHTHMSTVLLEMYITLWLLLLHVCRWSCLLKQLQGVPIIAIVIKCITCVCASPL